jgi:hypothetical protein
MMERKKGLFLVLLIVIIACVMLRLSSGEVPTQMEINFQNIAPQFLGSIPNQTWAFNTNLTDAFNLEDFFVDNDPLNYSASVVANITIIINETTHLVSFYPDKNFAGIRTVVFTATDGEYYTNSNSVTLNVTPDNNPPKWFSPSKQPSSVHQNSIVTLRTRWQDDVALGKFILSINQGSAWINQSEVSFSGIENISSYSIQISAPAGTVVFWFITAFDTFGNSNSTSIQNFTVAALPPPENPPSTGGGEEEEEASAEQTISKERRYSFIVDPESGFIIELIKGEDKTISFKVINTGNVEDTFNIDIFGLDGFDKLINKNNFTLPSGSTIVITVNFAAKNNLLPDIYIGSIRVKTPHATKTLPVIIELNELHILLALNLTIINNTEFLPTQNVSANIEIINMKDVQPREVYLYYAIADFNGNIINSASDQFVFDARSATIQKQLQLPLDIKVGPYIFFARIITNSSIAVSSDSFIVGEKRNLAGFILGNIWILLLIAAILIALLILATEHRNRKRLNLLNLYVLINELKQYIKENNLEEALKTFIKIKAYYNEPIAESLLNNKERLYEEMKNFTDKIDSKSIINKAPILQVQENKNQESNSGQEKQKEKKEQSAQKKESRTETKNPEQNKQETEEVEKKTENKKKGVKKKKIKKHGKKR